MKIYTRTGDSGQTSLLGGERVAKNDPRIEAYGTIDELNSVIGVVRAASPDPLLDPELHQIQMDLFEIGAQLASLTPTDRFPGVEGARVDALEKRIDQMDQQLPPLTNFILPGGTPAASHLHVARTVCRRAERLIIGLGRGMETGTTLIYLNRLSDYLFVAARFCNHRRGTPDTPWTRESTSGGAR